MTDIDAMVAEVRGQLDQPDERPGSWEGWSVAVTWRDAVGERTSVLRYISQSALRMAGFGGKASEVDLVGTEAKVAALLIKEQRDGRAR